MENIQTKAAPPTPANHHALAAGFRQQRVGLHLDQERQRAGRGSDTRCRAQGSTGCQKLSSVQAHLFISIQKTIPARRCRDLRGGVTLCAAHAGDREWRAVRGPPSTATSRAISGNSKFQRSQLGHKTGFVLHFETAQIKVVGIITDITDHR